jgi:Glycerophosphoryl diester phosphodiesterase family
LLLYCTYATHCYTVLHTLLLQTPEFIADCHRRGLKIWAWTVNMQTMVDLLVRRGIDGVCTDYPELVTSALQRHSSPVTSGTTTPVSAVSTAVVPATTATAVPPAAAVASVPASACRRALDLIYNELGAARTAVAAAVGESQCMNTALLQRSLRAPLTSTNSSESTQLTGLLAAACACAEEVLQPVLMSAKTFAWMMEVLQSEPGKKLLADVAAELANGQVSLLPFERKYLASVSTLA